MFPKLLFFLLRCDLRLRSLGNGLFSGAQTAGLVAASQFSQGSTYVHVVSTDLGEYTGIMEKNGN